MRLIAANTAANLIGLDELAAKSNYFIGNDPSKWRTNVSNYARVKCQQVYPGIDMIYYGTPRQFEYDFAVTPGADPGRIRIAFDGAQDIRIDDRGDLLLHTVAGQIRERKPTLYQEVDGIKKEVAGEFVLEGKSQVRFAVGVYDTSKPLVIDPVLVYSTYLGGSGDDGAFGIAVDSAGNGYVTGFTYTTDFLTTPGAFQSGFGGSYDAFITKLNPAGNAVIYSTYIGGSGIDDGISIALDSSSNIYVAGITGSSDFPTTVGAFQTSLNRGLDAFVLKLNATGDSLVYSSYLGGRSSDSPYGIAVDSSGSAYVTGFTWSDDFPTTSGAFQTRFVGGIVAFVTKFNESGTKLVYSTYLGRINTGVEESSPDTYGKHIAVDVGGNVYVTGYTSWTEFPVTPGAFQVVKNGYYDAFITKLNPTGTALVYSTFLGGSFADFGSAIAIDSIGNAYVTGNTSSNDFPVTPDCFQSAIKSDRDVFVTKLNASGTALVYSTYLGGSNIEGAADLSIDSLGNAYITGSTSSSDFPVVQPIQSINNSSPAYKSTDGGETWVTIAPNPAEQVVAGLAIDPVTPSNVYAASTSGIYKSTDGGKSWIPPSRSIPHISGISQKGIAIDPKVPTTLYVGTLTDGVYKSTDGGNRWTGLGPARCYVNCIVIDPVITSTLYAGVLIDFGGAIYKSTDGGDTWTQTLISNKQLRPSINALAILPATTSTLYAGTEDGVYKTTDGGSKWGAVSLDVPGVTDVVIDSKTPTTLYINSRGRGVFKSTDGGVTWRATELTSNALSTLAIDPVAPSTLYAGSFYGLYKSSNGGATWGRQKLIGDYVLSIAIDPVTPTTVYAGVSLASDVFVAKLNVTGTSLLYSTFLGGTGTDNSYGIAVDSAGSAYVTGATSTNFPSTSGALQTSPGSKVDAFIAKIRVDLPRIYSALITGKDLIVSGVNFDSGAQVLLDGKSQRTKNDVANPTTMLIGKKAGKLIARGQSVIVQVRNSDGALSQPFSFTRPID